MFDRHTLVAYFLPWINEHEFYDKHSLIDSAPDTVLQILLVITTDVCDSLHKLERKKAQLLRIWCCFCRHRVSFLLTFSNEFDSLYLYCRHKSIIDWWCRSLWKFRSEIPTSGAWHFARWSHDNWGLDKQGSRFHWSSSSKF